MTTEYTPIRVPMTVEAVEENVPMTAEEDGESVSMTLGTSINPTVVNADYNAATNKPAINGHELAAGENSLGDIGVYSADEVDDLLDDKADVTDLSAHEADTTVHVTAAEKAAWNGKADAADIPEKVSDLTNDAGYITGYTETDPTVPAWAKQSSKPTYTAAEVGALPDDTSIPTKTSELTNDSGFVTDNDVPGKLSDLTDDLGIGTHIADTTKHITAAERQSWNGKQVDALVGQADDSTASGYLTPTQVYNALAAGRDVVLTYTDSEFGTLELTAWQSANMDGFHIIAATAIVAYGAVFVVYELVGYVFNNTWSRGVTSIPSHLGDLDDNMGVADHIENTDIHVTAAQKTAWTGKQDAISDLATIRSGAALGATAVQTETDPTVPSWAKQASKPTYTASEVGLGNVDNTADADKPVSTATQAAIQNVIPYIVGTQTAATAAWKGVAPFATLRTGQAIIYHLPVAGTSTAATLELTLSDGETTTGAIDVLRLASSTVTTTFAAGCDIFMVFDGTDWKVSAYVDTNTNTIGYQLRTNSTSLPMSSITYRYRLLFTSADGTKLVPANNSTSTNATASRTVCQEKIDPWGRIVYYGTTTSVAAGSRPGAAYLWAQYVVTLGYSFNRTGAALALTSWEPVYVKATPQTDGSAIIDATTPYVQELPTTADGSIYIFLGIAVSATTVELVQCHPVYIFRNGKLQIFTGMEAEIDDIQSRLAALVDGDEVSY